MIVIEELLGLDTALVLASASPRRKYLLEQLNLKFRVQVADLDETGIAAGLAPSEYVETLALRKAQNVAARLTEPALVIGADTIVVLDGEILNKPADEAEAVAMLGTLSGNTHTVFTGIAIVETPGGRSTTALQRTEVGFRKLEEREIRAYVAGGSPMDKAGAYGIQDDFGAVFVREIRGCYYNVVGLPLELLYATLRDFCRTRV